MFATLRAVARRKLLSGVTFCESCSQVCSAECRGEARVARQREEIYLRIPHVF